MRTALLARVLHAGNMALLYVLLSGNVAWVNLVVAVLLGTGLSMLIPAGETCPRLRDWPRVFVALLHHGVLVAWDVIINGFLVASMVLWRTSRVQPGLVPMRNGHTSELGAALDAHSITLAPGTMVVSFEPELFRVHCLEAPKAVADGPDAGASRRTRIERFVGVPTGACALTPEKPAGGAL